jgi:CheY-like chemotaxis protein
VRVVITDLGMPYVDGRAVAGAVKSLAPSTPVILLTGWGQRIEVEGEVPAHVDKVLSKPPRLNRLREALLAVSANPSAGGSEPLIQG